MHGIQSCNLSEVQFASWQGVEREGDSTNLIIFSKWFLSFFITNFLLLLLLLSLLLQHLRPTTNGAKHATDFPLSMPNTKRRHRQRRRRLVKFSLVWFFLSPFAALPSSHHFVFFFYFTPSVFTTVWRQFCCPSLCPSLRQPRLALTAERKNHFECRVESIRVASSAASICCAVAQL